MAPLAPSTTATTSLLSHLECSACAKTARADRLQGPSPCCDVHLLARYDMEAAREAVTGKRLEGLGGGGHDLWRYAPLLPDPGPRGPVSLHEGGTPLLDITGVIDVPGCTVLAKDESRNPTGTFKARGLSVAVTRARALGATHLRAPTAGNAGGALALYAARAGLEATVAMPMDAAAANKAEVRAAGARLMEVDGLIADCARALEADDAARDAFDVSTFREPFRMEGKKTLGFELWEQCGGAWPDVVLFPTGGGLGVLAIAKAHEELTSLGVADGPPPRLVAVQSQGCAPLVRAFESGSDTLPPVPEASTVAGGIRVPTPRAGPAVLAALRASSGSAVAVPEGAIVGSMRHLAAKTGLFVGPESGAALAGVDALREAGGLDRGGSVAVVLTGTGFKHLGLFDAASGKG